MRDWRLRLKALLFWRRVEEELDDELRFHLAMEARKYASRGIRDEEAERLARVQFGGIEQVREECRTVRGVELVSTLAQDIRFALRGFARSPGFVLAVTGTIALALGLNSALFTLFNAYVLRPLSIRDPYSLYSLVWVDRSSRGHDLTWNEYTDFKRDNDEFSEIAGVRFLFARIEGHPMKGQLVTGNYFEMLGVGAALGRVLFPEDTAAPGREPVMVLNYSTWRDKFGSRPDIIGHKLILHGYPMEVVGVARPGFDDLSDTPRDFWAPLTMSPELEDGPDLFSTPDREGIQIVGRLKPGVTPRRADAPLEAWARRITAQKPEAARAAGVLLQSKATAIPLTMELVAAGSPLVVAFGLVLLLACANVANMMLARALARQREIGIRMSLGAARGRLIRQLMTESLLLAVPAALAGMVIGQSSLQMAMRLLYATVPHDLLEYLRTAPLPLDMRVFGFVLAAAFASAILFGLAPAIQVTRGDLMFAARGEFTSDVRPARLRSALVIGQVAVCSLLLISCGVLVRNAARIGSFDAGFGTRGITVFNIGDKLRDRVIAALQSHPEVASIAAASSTPLGGILPDTAITLSPGSAPVRSWYNKVSPEYFRMLDIPIVRGRNFSPDEAAGNLPVVILSASAAERLWPRVDPLGRVMRVDARDVQVIGVARDIVTCCVLYGKDPSLVYLPSTPSAPGNSLLVRVHGDVEIVRHDLDARVSAIAPGAILEEHPLDQYRALATYPFRAASWIGCAVAGLALLLTLSGIYGVLSFVVTQRTKEIGIRVALGATTSRVTRLVLEQSIRLAAIGLAIGLALAAGVCKLVSTEVAFLQPFDALSFAAGIALVFCATVAAAWYPSRRAAGIDPITSIRYE
jgi:predicted permease